MALPDSSVIRSYPGGAAPTYLATSLAYAYASGQTLTVANTTGWYEVSAGGYNTTNPLGTSGPFTLVVDYGLASEEKILCASGAIAVGVNTTINIYNVSGTNGRGYDGTVAIGHAQGGSSDYNVFPVSTAIEQAQFNLATSKIGNGTVILSGTTAGGDLVGTYPNPTLKPVGTSGTWYPADGQVPTITVDNVGRVTAFSGLNINITQAQVSGLASYISANDLTNSNQNVSISGNTADITSLFVTTSGQTTSINSLTAQVSGNTANISGNTTSINTLNSQVSGNTTSISGLNIAVSGQTTSINQLFATTSGQTTSISGLNASVSGLQVTVSGQNVTISGINTRIDTLSETTNSGFASVNTQISGLNVVISGQADTLATEANNIAVLSGQYVTLSGNLNTTNSNVATLSGQFVTLSGQYLTTSGIVTTATGNIATLSGQMITAQNGISTNATNLSTLSGQYNTTSGIVTNQTSYISTISGKQVTDESNIATISGNVATLSGQYATTSGIVTNHTSYISTISGKQITDEANIASTSGSLATLSGQYVTTSGIVVTNTSNIATTSGSLATLSGQFVTLSGSYNTTSGIVTNNTGYIATISGKQITDEANIASLSGSLATLSGQYVATSGIVTNNTSYIATISGKQVTDEANIASISGSLATVSGVAYAALPRTGGTISGSLTVTGTLSVNSTNIALGANTPIPSANAAGVAIGNYAGQTSNNNGVAVGAYAGSTQNFDGVAVGYEAGYYYNEFGVAIGYLANINNTGSNYTTAIGYQVNATAPGSVAIGTDHTGAGATSSTQDQIVLGTSNHTVNIPGNLTVSGVKALTNISGITASGDLSGTYPSPTVAKIQGIPVSSNTPANLQVMRYISASGAWVPGTGNALFPTATKSGNYTAAVNDYVVCEATVAPFTVTLPNAPSNGSVISVASQDTSTYAITVAASGSDTIGQSSTFVLPVGPFNSVSFIYDTAAAEWLIQSNQFGDVAGGDLGGYYPNPTVDRLQGTPVSNTPPNAGQVLASVGGVWTPITSSGIGTPGPGGANGYWFAGYDTTNQTLTTVLSGKPILIGTPTDQNGIVSSASGTITIGYTGTYNFQFSVQFQNSDNAAHNANVWLRKNGTNIAETNGTVAIPRTGSTGNGYTISSWNYIVAASGGDKFQFMWTADDTHVSIIDVAGLGTAPNSPGFIATVQQVMYNQTGTYTVNAIAASGTNQATATPLTLSTYAPITGATASGNNVAGTGVVLATPAYNGQWTQIHNQSTTGWLLVYPNSGATIDQEAADGPIWIPPSAFWEAVATTTLSWDTKTESITSTTINVSYQADGGQATINLPSTGTPGTYGTASGVSVITTDAQGRVTNVTATGIQIAQSQVTGLSGNLTAISGSLSTLSGNLSTLSGQYLTTSGIVTSNTSNIATLSGQMVTANANIASTSGSLATLSGQYVTTSGLVTNQAGYISTLSGQMVTVSGVAAAALPKAGGTMSGAIAMGSNKITGLTNGSAASDAAAFGQIPTTLPPNGSAGGSLAGTYPNPAIAANVTVTGLINISGTLTAPTITNGTISGSTLSNITVGGDLTGTLPNPTLAAVGTSGTYGSATAVPIIVTDSKGRVTGVTTAAPLDSTKLPTTGGTITGNLVVASGLTVSGTTTVNGFTNQGSSTISGNLTVVSGITVSGSAVMISGSAVGGDLTGTIGNAKVTKLQSYAVSSGAPTANAMLVYSGSQWTSGPVVSGTTGTGGVIPYATNPLLVAPLEQVVVASTVLTSGQAAVLNTVSGGVYVYTAAPTSVWQIQITNAPTTVGQAVTVTVGTNNGATAYLPSGFTINGYTVNGGTTLPAHGTAYTNTYTVTAFYQGGTIWSSADATINYDFYAITLICTAANTYVMLLGQTKF